jgi:hypothetical protein
MFWFLQYTDLMRSYDDMLDLWIKVLKGTPEVYAEVLKNETFVEMLTAAENYLKGSITKEQLSDLADEIVDKTVYFWEEVTKPDHYVLALCHDLTVLCDPSQMGPPDIWGIGQCSRCIIKAGDGKVLRLQADIIRKETNFFKDDKQELELYELFGVK